MANRLRKRLKELKLVRKSALFDAEWYAKRYHVPAALAAYHFIRQEAGTANPCAAFSAKGYLNYNTDVAQSGINPLVHYELYGKLEERMFPPAVQKQERLEFYDSPLFDLDFYAKTYLGEKAGQIHPVDHYFDVGHKNGCLPGRVFDAEKFKADHPQADNPVVGFVKEGLCSDYLKEPMYKLRGAYKWADTIAAYHHERQERLFADKHAGDKCIIFLVPPIDFVGGGVMSFDNLAARSQEMTGLHGRAVLVATMPGKATFSRYTGFAGRCDIFRFEQALRFARDCGDILLMVPECVIDELVGYADSGAPFFRLDALRCNVLDQNHDDFLKQKRFERLKELIPRMTMTCAHEKYCTPENRARFGVPLHLLPADLPARFYNIPYAEKKDILAYSNDAHPQKAQTLERIHTLLPALELVEIDGLPYDDYLKLIGTAKWTLTFGEGWDAYFIQPYFSRSIGFTVFNPQFCPERMHGLPTVFESYEELPDKLAAFIRENDSAGANERVRALVLGTLFPPSDNPAPPADPLTEFYKGNYTFE